MPSNSSFENRNSFSSKTSFSFCSVNFIQSFHHVKEWTDTAYCMFAFESEGSTTWCVQSEEQSRNCAPCAHGTVLIVIRLRKKCCDKSLFFAICSTQPQPQKYQKFQTSRKGSCLSSLWKLHRIPSLSRTLAGGCGQMDGIGGMSICLSLQAPQMLGERRGEGERGDRGSLQI